MLMKIVQSFRDLPVYPYQIQTKFRNETVQRAALCAAVSF